MAMENHLSKSLKDGIKSDVERLSFIMYLSHINDLTYDFRFTNARKWLNYFLVRLPLMKKKISEKPEAFGEAAEGNFVRRERKDGRNCIFQI